MLAETPVRTRGSDEIPESTEHRSWSIAGFALEISFWIARPVVVVDQAKRNSGSLSMSMRARVAGAVSLRSLIRLLHFANKFVEA